jgi:hypothetical protein
MPVKVGLVAPSRLVASRTHVSLSFQTLRDSDIASHRGFDLCNYDDKVAPVTPMLSQRVLKEWTLAEFKVGFTARQNRIDC